MDIQQTNTNDEILVRKSKYEQLKEEFQQPYKDSYQRSHTIKQARALDIDDKTKICGRLISRRVMGKLIFANLYDIEATIQISLSKADNEEDFEFFKNFVDIGDYLGIEGEVYRTKRGEFTVRSKSMTLLSKALRPLPEKFHGLTDIDRKYRQRYLDLIANEDSRIIFTKRIKILNSIREFLINNSFVEVETPILQNVACGANAKPFITKHNSLDKEYFLRIAPELYLKQVVQCGFDRVFELGKNFRNEGMDGSHLQEFTMLEWYAAYWNYKDNIEFLINLLKKVISDANGSLEIEYQGIVLDFSQYEYLDYTSEVSKTIGANILEFENAQQIKERLIDIEMFTSEEIKELYSIPSVIDYIFKKKIRPYIIQPTITYNYPACLIPLARRNDENPKQIDMFQLVVNGWEIVKAYSELINPMTQREAFEEQAKNKEFGDDEAMDTDDAFLIAMEHGMPPMSGLGLGIDRLVSLLTNQPTLRDVIFFPLMK